MATYAKILKDNAGNQILPYTRSKLVYMNDGYTVEDAINNIQNQGGYTLPTASAYTLGGVKIGNNIYNDNGTISIRISQVCNALGYQPLSHRGGSCPVTSDDIIDALGYTPSSGSSNMTPDYYHWDMSNVNTFIDNNKFSISDASSRFSSCDMYITMYSSQIAFCTLYLTPKSNMSGHSNNGGQQLRLGFSSHGTGSMKKLFPIYNFSKNISPGYKQIGFLEVYCENGGTFMRMMNIVLSEALAAGETMYSSFILCPF